VTTLARWLGFDGDTFLDHEGQTSFARKALAAMIACMILLVFVSLGLVSWLDKVQGEAVQKVLSSALTALGSVISVAFAAVQGAKAHAQAANGKAKPPAPKPPDPPKGETK